MYISSKSSYNKEAHSPQINQFIYSLIKIPTGSKNHHDIFRKDMYAWKLTVIKINKLDMPLSTLINLNESCVNKQVAE